MVVEPLDECQLQDLARLLRFDVLEMTCRHHGHLSSCYSCAEILAVLYKGGVMRYDPAQPWWPERDRFVLSKGHAAPVFYAILARAGFFPLEKLRFFREADSPFHGHPLARTLPGIENTSGSLGQGLSFGLGCALAGRLARQDYRTYVLLGDGECQEGQIWEAAMAASHWHADRLTAIVDYNGYQQSGPISQEMALEPFADKWRSFGWHAQEVDGHDVVALQAALRVAQTIVGRPTVIIGHTVKGKGVSFVEKDFSFHGKGLSPEQAARAREELGCH